MLLAGNYIARAKSKNLNVLFILLAITMHLLSIHLFTEQMFIEYLTMQDTAMDFGKIQLSLDSKYGDIAFSTLASGNNSGI